MVRQRIIVNKILKGLPLKVCRTRVHFPFLNVLVFLGGLFKKKNKELHIRRFENSFKEYSRTANAIAVSSGKIALYLCLKALNFKKGTEIILTAYTVSEVADIIVLCGLKPVFIDIDPDTGNMDDSLIESRINSRTRALLMTHMYGNPCDVDKITELCQRHGIVLIEDAAQALGAEYKGRKAGTFGKVGYFSFGFLKNLNTLGGGMIISNDDLLAERIRQENSRFSGASTVKLMRRLVLVYALNIFTNPIFFTVCVYPLLRLFPENKRRSLHQVFAGKKLKAVDLEKLKYRFSYLQAGLGLRQICRIESQNEKRIRNADLYNEAFKFPIAPKIFFQREGCRNIYLNYVIRVKKRDILAEKLFAKGIDIGQGLIGSCPELERYMEFAAECPQSRALQEENLYLPVDPFLSPLEVIKIAEAVRQECADL